MVLKNIMLFAFTSAALALSLPAAAVSNMTVITANAYSSDFTLKVDGKCSTEVGVIGRQAQVQVPSKTIAQICSSTNSDFCKSEIYASASCQGEPIALMAFNNNGNLSYFLPKNNHYIFISKLNNNAYYYQINIEEKPL